MKIVMTMRNDDTSGTDGQGGDELLDFIKGRRS